MTKTMPAVPEIPGLPRDADGPVFDAPWQAQAFAMAVRLNEQGLFTWPEWAERFGAERARSAASGAPDTHETYFLGWLAALERIVVEKGATSGSELLERKHAWDRAAKATPHGQPIVLGAEARKC